MVLVLVMVYQGSLNCAVLLAEGHAISHGNNLKAEDLVTAVPLTEGPSFDKNVNFFFL